MSQQLQIAWVAPAARTVAGTASAATNARALVIVRRILLTSSRRPRGPRTLLLGASRGGVTGSGRDSSGCGEGGGFGNGSGQTKTPPDRRDAATRWGRFLVEILRRLRSGNDAGDVGIDARGAVSLIFPILAALLTPRDLLAASLLAGELLLPFQKPG